MRRKRYQYWLVVIVLVCLYHFLGVGDYIHARSFDDFDYPLHMDIQPIVNDLLAGKKTDVAPINKYPYRFLTNITKCSPNLDLLIIVKSAMTHFGHRMAIRKTFGQENFKPGRNVQTVFVLGLEMPPSATQANIEKEISEHRDIIQIDFLDSYYNNTIKTMMSFRWVYERCSNADFYLFTDDDMYISVDNLLDYVHDQTLHGDDYALDNDNDILTGSTRRRDKHLFAGHVFKSAPQRFMMSKWRVSLEEYPWDAWPTYVTAGAYVVSGVSMRTLYLGSLFVKHFKFDDVYLGIVAKKVGVAPTHCGRFHFFKVMYSKEGYRDVIASHGYGDHDELVRVWEEQNDEARGR